MGPHKEFTTECTGMVGLPTRSTGMTFSTHRDNDITFFLVLERNKSKDTDTETETRQSHSKRQISGLDGHYDATDAWLGLGWPWSVLPVPGSWQVYWSKAGPTPGLVQVFRLFYKICPRWHASLMMLVSPTGSRSQGIISVQETVNLASFC